MHISEGVLSAPVLITGAALAVAGTAIGLKKMDSEKIPQAAMLSAVFFMGTLVHIPLVAASVHLVLNGLLGIILGWMAFPAILIGLTFQAILFQHGGLTTLGINTLNMALPAVICYYLCGPWTRNGSNIHSLIASFAAGFLAVLMSTAMLAGSLVFTGEAFTNLALTASAAQLPVMIAEGVVTAFCIQFLRKVKPEVLDVSYAG